VHSAGEDNIISVGTCIPKRMPNSLEEIVFSIN